MKIIINDGGRKAAGFTKAKSGDCVVRAIAIASGLPYREVHEELHAKALEYVAGRRTKLATQMRKSSVSPDNGTFKDVYHNYILSLGFVWTPLVKIGTGCTVHLNDSELPAKGAYILRLSKHLAAWVDGKLHDTYDCSRGGTRCVYGYYQKVEVDNG